MIAAGRGDGEHGGKSIEGKIRAHVGMDSMRRRQTYSALSFSLEPPTITALGLHGGGHNRVLLLVSGVERLSSLSQRRVSRVIHTVVRARKSQTLFMVRFGVGLLVRGALGWRVQAGVASIRLTRGPYP